MSKIDGGKSKQNGAKNSDVLRSSLLVLAMSFGWSADLRAELPAGTTITNVASLHVPAIDGTDRTIVSNRVDLTVGEVLDVALNARGAGGRGAMTLTNRGNGAESFVLSTADADDAAAIDLIAHDVDDDGRFDPARDTVLAGGRTPVLASGARLALVVVLKAGTAKSIAVSAVAATGSGAPGTIIAAGGDGGGDAVIGSTGGAAQLSIAPESDSAAPTLTKTQTVRAPDGSTAAVRGAVITYSLVARFVTATPRARLHDVIPAGTRYVADSLRLGATPLSDAADADAGGFDGTAINVSFGDIAAPAIQTVQFQVQIL